MHGLTTVAPIPAAGARAALPADEPAPAEGREIRFLGDLQRLQPQPGDVFVLTVEGRISAVQADVIQRHWAQTMGDFKLLVLDSSAQLECIGAGSGD